MDAPSSEVFKVGRGPGQPDLEGGILAHGRASELKGLF